MLAERRRGGAGRMFMWWREQESLEHSSSITKNNPKLARCIMENFGTDTSRDWKFCFRSTKCLRRCCVRHSEKKHNTRSSEGKVHFRCYCNRLEKKYASKREGTPCCYKACLISATKHAPDVRKHGSMLNCLRHSGILQFPLLGNCRSWLDFFGRRKWKHFISMDYMWFF